jgi:putative acetyltransferase
VRSETPADYSAVRRVNERAFGGAEEAQIVEALRGTATPQISLVAEREGRVVGHIFFSPVTVESPESSFEAIALGPLAVEPELHKKGVGSRLMHAGLEECRRAGHGLVFVLGHPGYYPRFGFRKAAPGGFRCEFDAPDEAFMFIELVEGAGSGRRGLVRYRPEFGVD